MSDPTVHVDALKSDIRKAIINQKVNSCPMAVRLAWHASGTFDKSNGTGGSDGASMRYPLEAGDGANAGLGIARDLLKPVAAANPGVSTADIWTAAGSYAIELTGGPKVPVAFCRSDADSEAACPENGRLPDAALGADHLRDVFYRQGFNDQEIVALSGAHTLGRCHLSRSGFDGPWTSKPLVWDNEYFRNLLEKTWVPKEYSGNAMFEDEETRTLGMLPTDIALIKDDKFLPYVELYAKDAAKFDEDFAAAFAKLLANGTKCPYPIPAAPALSEKQQASRDFREYAMHGSEREVRRLAPQADANEVEVNSGRTALHKAAFWGHDHLIAFLTGDCGVKTDTQDNNGDTALHDAARFGHAKVVELLLAAGAGAAVKNTAGQTAKEVAAEYGYTGIAGL